MNGPSAKQFEEIRSKYGMAVRICMTVAVLMLLIEGVQVAHMQSVNAQALASTYSCPPPNCHSLQDWPGGMNGSSTNIEVVPISCTPCIDLHGNQTGFVDNEMWLNDNSNADWMETGYTTYSRKVAGSREDYFWAYGTYGNGTLEVDLGLIPQGDYGNYTFFEIHRYSGSQFQIVVSSTNFYDVPYVTESSMAPNDINIGQELEGSGGASASTAHFIYNMWIDGNGVAHYQTSSGSLYYNNPPYVGWSVPPWQSSTGGTLWTRCC